MVVLKLPRSAVRLVCAESVAMPARTLADRSVVPTEPADCRLAATKTHQTRKRPSASTLDSGMKSSSGMACSALQPMRITSMAVRMAEAMLATMHSRMTSTPRTSRARITGPYQRGLTLTSFGIARV